jgi:hypothetical protein
MNRFVALGVAGAAAVSLCGPSQTAGAQITKQGDAYLFRMKFSKGQKMSYTITSSAKVPNNPAAIKAVVPMSMTVQDVKGGIATIQLVTGPMTVNGKPLGPQPQTTVIKLDDRGKPVGGAMPGQQVSTQLPEKPLKVGGTYTATNTVNMMGQQFAVKSTNKFLGIKHVGSRNVAAIATTMTGSGAMKSSGTGVAYLDVKDGSLVSMKMNQKVTMTQGAQAQTINSVVTVTRK